MHEPRFVVSSVTGYSIGTDGVRSGRAPTTSYTVIDRAYCHRAVATFVARRYQSDLRRWTKATRLCGRLNREHEAWMRDNAA